VTEGSVVWTVPEVPGELGESGALAALGAALAHGGEPELRVDIIFVDDAELARLHGQVLGDPTRTDVITFDLRDDGAPDEHGPDGEIYVSVERAREVAMVRGVSVQREQALYVVHGALHLVGFDDHDPEERAAMRSAEAVVMEGLGYDEDPGEHEV